MLFTPTEIMNYVWIILFCGVVGVRASPVCTEDALQKCNHLKFKDDLDITFPKNEQELKSQCSSERVPLYCYADFVERCPTFVTNPVREFYIKSKKLFDRICDHNGDLQSKYLRNALCISDVMTNGQEECVAEHEDKEEEGVCVYQTALVRCLGSMVADNCGEEALDIMREVYRVMKPLIENGECENS